MNYSVNNINRWLISSLVCWFFINLAQNCYAERIIVRELSSIDGSVFASIIIGDPKTKLSNIKMIEKIQGFDVKKVIKERGYLYAITIKGGVFKSQELSNKVINDQQWSSIGLSGKNILSICVDDDQLYFGTEDGKIYKIKFTEEIISKELDYQGKELIQNLITYRGIVYAGTNNGLLKRIKEGDWQPVVIDLANKDVKVLHSCDSIINPLDNIRKNHDIFKPFYGLCYGWLFAVTGDGKIYRTQDGAQWEKISSPTNQSGIFYLVSRDGCLYLIDEYGNIFFSKDGGGSWSRIGSDDLKNAEVTSVLLNDCNLIIGMNQGVYLKSLEEEGCYRSDKALPNYVSSLSEALRYWDEFASWSDFKVKINQRLVVANFNSDSPWAFAAFLGKQDGKFRYLFSFLSSKDIKPESTVTVNLSDGARENLKSNTKVYPISGENNAYIVLAEFDTTLNGKIKNYNIVDESNNKFVSGKLPRCQVVLKDESLLVSHSGLTRVEFYVDGLSNNILDLDQNQIKIDHNDKNSIYTVALKLGKCEAGLLVSNILIQVEYSTEEGLVEKDFIYIPISCAIRDQNIIIYSKNKLIWVASGLVTPFKYIWNNIGLPIIKNRVAGRQ